MLQCACEALSRSRREAQREESQWKKTSGANMSSPLHPKGKLLHDPGSQGGWPRPPWILLDSWPDFPPLFWVVDTSWSAPAPALSTAGCEPARSYSRWPLSKSSSPRSLLAGLWLWTWAAEDSALGRKLWNVPAPPTPSRQQCERAALAFFFFFLGEIHTTKN